MSKDVYVVYSLDQLNSLNNNVKQSGILATFFLKKKTISKVLKKAIKAIEIATDSSIDLIDYKINEDNTFMYITGTSYGIVSNFELQQILIKIK